MLALSVCCDLEEHSLGSRLTDDLQAISDYLAEHHPTLRQSTARKLYSAARSLKHFPNRGRLGAIEGTRELPMAPLPYIIVYGVQPDLVYIYRIIHTSEEWTEAL